jgi:pimeloyl-ACP methyl ester carboxylesterase
MADDVAGLLKFFKIPAAHIAGVSMGGMISQTFAINHSEKCLSLCSISSTTGQRGLEKADFQVTRLLLKKPKPTHEARIAMSINVLTAISHPASPNSDLPAYCSSSLKRSYHPVGASRQLNAIMAQKDRSFALGLLKTKHPTMSCAVIHGDGDRLVKLAHGEATAAAIGGNVMYRPIKGLGHVITEVFNEQVVGIIAANCARSGVSAVDSFGITDVEEVEIMMK